MFANVESVFAVSIRAPARGATFMIDWLNIEVPRFNSRSREGSDFCQYICGTKQRSFNSRSREGSDDPCFNVRTL